MPDEWKEAAKELPDDEKRRALKYIAENSSGPMAGIARQILGEEKKPLTNNQKHIYEDSIEPSLVEKCGGPGCKNFAVAGDTYCPTCAIEYGQ
ncbi:hypothetical protein [Salinicola sp. RZ23]|uniref:hypothetical protein n=1 Tax=Salinicola sp. RZ23 TaxID=1949087 RepID=UPI00130046F0|nr:hypothetical protein [Salinicola sp. RZ23]